MASVGEIIMEKYLYINNQFLPTVLKDEWIGVGMWDEEKGIFVSEEIFVAYPSEKDGKLRATGADGMPEWVDPPAPTKEQLVLAAEIKRQSLLAEVNSITSNWRAELALGIIDDSDKEKLTEWMQYIKAVKAVDASKAPDIEWPTPPVFQAS